MSAQRQGFELEEQIHDVLAMLPGVTAMRESDIKRQYGNHITGLDHMAIRGNHVVCVQDKWENHKPNTRDISHTRAQSELLQKQFPPDYIVTVIFASKMDNTEGGAVSMQDHGIRHVHDTERHYLVCKVAVAASRALGFGDHIMLEVLAELRAHATHGIAEIIAVGRQQLANMADDALTTPTPKDHEIQHAFDDLTVGLLNIRHRFHPTTYQRFTDALELSRDDRSRFPLKTLWAAYTLDVNTYEVGCRGDLSNVHELFEHVVAAASRVDGKRYKWSTAMIKRIPMVNYFRAKHFCYFTARANYGNKYWDAILKLGEHDLRALVEHRIECNRMNLDWAPRVYLAREAAALHDELFAQHMKTLAEKSQRCMPYLFGAAEYSAAALFAAYTYICNNNNIPAAVRYTLPQYKTALKNKGLSVTKDTVSFQD